MSFREEFIATCLSRDVLRFGEFTLKSGRLAPYFFNAGQFSDGDALWSVALGYASTIKEYNFVPDVIFGPAYKGVPLAPMIAAACSHQAGADGALRHVEWAYNRKEEGSLVGASMDGKRVLIVDDVITGGTAIRETLELLEKKTKGVTVVGVLVALDRQEVVGNPAEGEERMSAVQGVAKQYGFPVISVLDLAPIEQHLIEKNDTEILAKFRAYREQYGVEKTVARMRDDVELHPVAETHGARGLDLRAQAEVMAAPLEQRSDVELVFGLAYSGIPIGAMVAARLAEVSKRRIEFGYNRLAEKDHGEGGTLVGAKLTGKKAWFFGEDATTAEKLAAAHGATLVGFTQV